MTDTQKTRTQDTEHRQLGHKIQNTDNQDTRYRTQTTRTQDTEQRQLGHTTQDK